MGHASASSAVAASLAAVSDCPKDPRRRGVGWTSVGHGVRIPSGLSGRAELLAELRAWQEVMPAGAAWTGLTAAEVHGLWMPTPTPGLPRFAATGTVPGAVTVARPQLAISRHASAPLAVTIDGVRVVPVPDCIVATSRFLPTLDLVVLLDSARQLGKSTLAELVDAAGRRVRGARPTRAALRLSDGRSESAWETLLRLLHVVCGIDVEPQPEILDPYGRFVARADLRVVGTDLLQEYDGADHQQARQQRKALVRARAASPTSSSSAGATLRPRCSTSPTSSCAPLTRRSAERSRPTPVRGCSWSRSRSTARTAVGRSSSASAPTGPTSRTNRWQVPDRAPWNPASASSCRAGCRGPAPGGQEPERAGRRRWRAGSTSGSGRSGRGLRCWPPWSPERRRLMTKARTWATAVHSSDGIC